MNTDASIIAPIAALSTTHETKYPSHLCNDRHGSVPFPCWWSAPLPPQLPETQIDSIVSTWLHDQGYFGGFQKPRPPFSNTGGLTFCPKTSGAYKAIPPTYQDLLSPGTDFYDISSFDVTPALVRASESLKTFPVSIDFCSFVVDMGSLRKHYYKDYVNDLPLDRQQLEDFSVERKIYADEQLLVSLFCDDLSKFVSDSYFDVGDRGLFNYKHSGTIRRGLAHAGKFAWGGNGGGLLVSLSGTGCKFVDFKDAVLAFLLQFDFHFTRVDIAHDDFENAEFSFQYWLDQAISGEFNKFSRGKKPNIKYDLNSKTEKGNTFTVGDLRNGKAIQFYEKGKQLGMASNPWYRCEVRFSNHAKPIPLDIFERPQDYFFGANDILTKFGRNFQVIASKFCSAKAKVKITIEKGFDNIKNSAGKWLNAFLQLGYTEKEIIERCVRDGIPKRLEQNMY